MTNWVEKNKKNLQKPPFYLFLILFMYLFVSDGYTKKNPFFNIKNCTLNMYFFL